MSMTSCRNFSGYKPCTKSEVCDAQCASLSIPQTSLLIVHLGALGAVVRSTSLLKSIKRKFPNSMITWVTEAPAHKLLQNHPAIDRVLTTSSDDMFVLAALEFDVGFVVDKSLKAAGVLKRTTVDQVYGFVADPANGAILPATPSAEELWSLGLDNHKKFFVNTKPETQLMIEALELGPYQRDDYWLPLTAKEEVLRIQRRCEFLAPSGKDIVIGLNTGCSDVISYKKLTVDFQRQLVQEIAKNYPNAQIVLLGGPEDTVRNELIARGLPVINTSTESGLRDGLVSVAACDVVITGDSLGMHMAISQGCQVIAWFGPTCAHEIDLFGRGVALKTQAGCSPCWKRTCEKATMCYDQVPLEDFLNALESCCADRLSRRPAALHTSAEEDQSHLS